MFPKNLSNTTLDGFFGFRGCKITPSEELLISTREILGSNNDVISMEFLDVRKVHIEERVYYYPKKLRSLHATIKNEKTGPILSGQILLEVNIDSTKGNFNMLGVPPQEAADLKKILRNNIPRMGDEVRISLKGGESGSVVDVDFNLLEVEEGYKSWFLKGNLAETPLFTQFVTAEINALRRCLIKKDFGRKYENLSEKRTIAEISAMFEKIDRGVWPV